MQNICFTDLLIAYLPKCECNHHEGMNIYVIHICFVQCHSPNANSAWHIADIQKRWGNQNVQSLQILQILAHFLGEKKAEVITWLTEVTAQADLCMLTVQSSLFTILLLGKGIIPTKVCLFVLQIYVLNKLRTCLEIIAKIHTF